MQVPGVFGELKVEDTMQAKTCTKLILSKSRETKNTHFFFRMKRKADAHFP